MASLRWNTIAIAILLTPVAFGSSDPLLPPQVIELNVPKAEGQDNVQRLILEWTELPAGLKTDIEKLRLKDHLVTQGRADLSSIATLLENGLPDSGLGKGFFARVIGETKDLKGTPLLYNAFANSKEFDEKLEILKGIESLGDPAAISLLLPHLDCGTDGSDILSRQKMADAVELNVAEFGQSGRRNTDCCQRMYETYA